MSEKVEAKATNFNSMTGGLEKWLDETVNKKQPLQLPLGARTWIADNSWWLAIIGGVLSLWGAWSFWQLGHYVDSLSRFADDLARYTGTATASSQLGFMWYLALLGMAVEGVLLLLAVSPLKARKKSGWNLLLYVSLVSLFVSIVYLFVPSYGFGSLFGTLIGTAISWFFLFQIRSRFVK